MEVVKAGCSSVVGIASTVADDAVEGTGEVGVVIVVINVSGSEVVVVLVIIVETILIGVLSVVNISSS
jgi:hypothetical protein